MKRKSVWLSVIAAMSMVTFASCATFGGGDGDGIAARAASAALGDAFDSTMLDIVGYAMTAAEAAIAIVGLDATSRAELLAIANAAAIESATDALSVAVEEARDAALGAAGGIAGQAAMGAFRGAIGGGAGGAADGALVAAQNAARSAADTVFDAARVSASGVARDAALSAVNVALAGAGLVAAIPAPAPHLLPSVPAPGLQASGVPPALPPAAAQHSNLDAAIWSAAADLSSVMGSGARVAVLAMGADSARMSDFLIDEKIVALGVSGLSVVSRPQLNQFVGQLNFNTAEPASEAMAQLVGRFMGVQYVITGAFEPLAGFFRFRTQAIEVETAATRGIHTVSVPNDALVSYLLGTGAIAAAPAPAGLVAAPPPTLPPPAVAALEPSARGNRRWASLELDLLGAGARVEFALGSRGLFTAGLGAFHNIDSLPYYFLGPGNFANFSGAKAFFRFFPGGSPFYLEAGIGGGRWAIEHQVWHWGDSWGGGLMQWERSEHTGLMLTPALGLRFSGNTFFVNPFLGLVWGISDWWLIAPRLGVAVGFGW